ncbi:OsmC family protein [Haloglycomyces albus]|uniref:OsmC family protein n=1 Tax=Haloglycomyces albus TaxID=526067 RepID=UPI0004A48B50|nr:OsmC family protein [Haloglycomyces albus]
MKHEYDLTVTWTGNTGEGTRSYRSFERDHTIAAAGKPTLRGSADPSFRGSAERWNPEELLLASLSECHMMSYLALCSQQGVVVTAYHDEALGTMETGREGGRFTRALLRPVVTLAESTNADLQLRAKAGALHVEAHRQCFIANSVNFPVDCEPTFH